MLKKNLSDLACILGCKIKNEKTITNFSIDSRHVKNNSIFLLSMEKEQMDIFF